MTGVLVDVRASNASASELRLDDRTLHVTRLGLVTTADRSRRMGDIRQRATKPELAVREALAQLGIRYRVNARTLPGRPDIANVRQRFAIFVHGCFWHRHPGCSRATSPARNAAFWQVKFDANVERDRQAREALQARGFRVLTVWECQTTDAPLLRHTLRTQLPIGVSDTEASRPRAEFFEVDKDGSIWRVVQRRVTAKLVRTRVGAVPKGKRRNFSQDDLRAFADTVYLREQPVATNDTLSGEELSVLDVFGGCGAMTLGVAEACRAAGVVFRPAGILEIEPTALAVYASNFGGPQPRRDVAHLLSRRLSTRFTGRELALKKELGRVDMIVAGPPCQGHSNLNNETRRKDPRNELYFRLARLTKLFRPRWIIVENVPAVLHDDGNVVARTTRALRRLGYSVSSGLINVAELGVPQTRRRHALIATRCDRRRPSPTAVTVADIMAKFRTPHRDLGWAIADLRAAGRDDMRDRSAQPTPTTERRIRWLFDHKAYELPNWHRPKCHRHHRRDVGRDHRYIGVYGRMRWDRPGPTITGGYDTMGRGRFVHPSQRRTITPHEAARVQFLPDWFDLSPAARSRSAMARIIGNAVPPKLTYALALELIR